MDFLYNLITGIGLGSIYAIIALGYTMVYGIAKMLNFAHGDVIMVGGYTYFLAVSEFELGMNPVVGVLLAIVICTILGMTIERVAYKPLRQAPSLAVLITAIGVSYLLQNGAQILWSTTPKTFDLLQIKVNGSASLTMFDGQLSVKWVSIITIVVCVIVMIALTLFTGKTRTGKAMRACSEDKEAAQLMGISVNKTISITFAIGSALAAIAGILYCIYSTKVMSTTGSIPGIKAFTAAVVGGIGSIPGALLGGILLGVIEIFARSSETFSVLADAIVFAVLIIVLLVKPTGLLGKQVREKV